MLFFELPAPPHPRHAADLTYLKSLIFTIIPNLDFGIECGQTSSEPESSIEKEICDTMKPAELEKSFCSNLPYSISEVSNRSDGSVLVIGSADLASAFRTGDSVLEPQFSSEKAAILGKSPIEKACVSEQLAISADARSPIDSEASSPSNLKSEQPTTPVSQPDSSREHFGYGLAESPAGIPIRYLERPFPDSPAIIAEGNKLSDSGSDDDCFESTIIFRPDTEDAINNQLDDAIDSMSVTGNENQHETSHGSAFGVEVSNVDMASQSLHSHDTEALSSILPSFHPLAAACQATGYVNQKDSLKKVPLRKVLTLREQFQALQRLSIIEINREFSDERLQLASQLQSNREKSEALDFLSDQVIEYANSFQKIVETAYKQFSSMKITAISEQPNPVSASASFSVNGLWDEMKKSAVVENDHWLELLAKFRSVCLVPLCVDLQEIRNLATALFAEAEALDNAIVQAETAHVNSVQQFQTLTQRRSISARKLSAVKLVVPGRSTKPSSDLDTPSSSGEFEAEFLTAEIQRLTSEEQLRIYAETWKKRLPEILSECRELNQKRVTTLHAALIALLDFKNSIFSDRLCQVSQLQETATRLLQLEDDLNMFNKPNISISSGDSSLGSRSARSHHQSGSVCDSGYQTSPQDVSSIIRDYFLSENRSRSFVIDMWGIEGVRRTYEFLHSSKEVLSQVYAVLEGITPAFEISAKQMKKVISSHKTSSAKYFSNEPIQQSWLSLLDAFQAEADANKNTAKFMKRAVVVLDHIRSEGKQLRVLFTKQRSAIEKQIANTTQEASHAFEQKRIKSAQFVASKDRLNRNLDFSSCPNQDDFQPFIAQFLAYQQASLSADNDVIRIERRYEHLLLQDDIITSVFLRFAQDCMMRHYMSTKKVLQGIYKHMQSQNESSQRSLQRMERMVQAIDTENDLREFIVSVEKKENVDGKRSEGDELPVRQQIDTTEFNSFHSKSWKGISSLRFLISLFQESSTIDDGFVRILRKFPWDFSSLRQSLKYSSLVGAFIHLQKTVECMSNCIDERSSRMKEISKSLKRQKSIIKTNISDIAHQHQSAHKRVSSVEASFNNISSAYRKAVENVDKISQRNEKDQDREKKAGTERRQSFIVTMIQGRLPSKSPRQRMDSAVEVAERTQRALDHSTASLKDALSSFSTMKKSHIQSLQNINSTRINAVKWAFTTHCEHQTFYSQQLADYLSGLNTSIDRVCAETDLDAFVRANGISMQQPPDRVILSTLDPGSFSRLETDLSALDSGSYGDSNTTISFRESVQLDQTCGESDISVESSLNESFI